MKDHEELEEAANKAMAELDALMDGAPPPLPPSQMALLLGQQYGELLRRFWLLRNQGEICTIVGDHGEAKGHFEGAKGAWKRMQALRELADERGVRADVDLLISEFEAQEKERAAKIRAEQTQRAARTGTVAPLKAV